jgi:ABC-type multidrug transport system permease subunit
MKLLNFVLWKYTWYVKAIEQLISSAILFLGLSIFFGLSTIPRCCRSTIPLRAASSLLFLSLLLVYYPALPVSLLSLVAASLQSVAASLLSRATAIVV